MPGGKRPGAGRRPGSVNKLTAKVAQAAAAEGISPIEVMLSAMRGAWQKSLDKPDEPEHLHNAVNWADRAAPYVHARIQSIAHSGSVDSEVTGRLVVTWGGDKSS